MDLLLQNNQWLWILAFLWTLPWKGIALWRAARNNERNWFVALLIVNSLAILEIVYIFYFSKRHEAKKEVALPVE